MTRPKTALILVSSARRKSTHDHITRLIGGEGNGGEGGGGEGDGGEGNDGGGGGGDGDGGRGGGGSSSSGGGSSSSGVGSGGGGSGSGGGGGSGGAGGSGSGGGGSGCGKCSCNGNGGGDNGGVCSSSGGGAGVGGVGGSVLGRRNGHLGSGMMLPRLGQRPLCYEWATRIVDARLAVEPSGVVRCEERFKLGDVLGSGAFATVFRATCLTSGRLCAVKKVARPVQALGMVRREASVLRLVQGHFPRPFLDLSWSFPVGVRPPAGAGASSRGAPYNSTHPAPPARPARPAPPTTRACTPHSPACPPGALPTHPPSTHPPRCG